MTRIALIAAVIIATLMVMIVVWPTSSSLFETSKSELTPHPKTWNLRLGHNMPTESALHEAALLYAQKVFEKSGGKVRITVHPNQELGTDFKMVEMARRGELDIIITPTAEMGIALPSMQYVDLPFYFPTREDTYRMLDGEPGEMLFDELKKIGLIGVTFWENGFKHFSANTPLYAPEDFEGKKFRIMKSRLIEAQFQALGATTLPIDFHKTRQALADGVVDGQENPLIAIESMHIDDVQKHLLLSSHGYMGYLFAISAKTFARIPSELHPPLYDTARDLTPYERKQTHKKEKALLEKMAAKGLMIHTLTDVQRSAFAETMKPLIPRFEEMIGPHLLAKTDELLLERYGPSPQSHEQIVIGLDVDLSGAAQIGSLAIKRGVELAIEEINAQGGVLGKKLVLLCKDNRGSASIGENNVRSLIERDDVVAIMGGVLSAVIVESIDETSKAAIPHLIPWGAAEKLTHTDHKPNPLFRLSANDGSAITFMGEHLLNRYERVSIVYENSVWGREGYGQFLELSRRLGKPITEAVMFNAGQNDFDPTVVRLKQSKTQALLLIANAPETNVFLQTLDTLNFRVPIISHWGITGNTLHPKTLQALRRLDLRVFQTFSFLHRPTPQSARLAQRYLNRYGVSSVDAIKAPSGVAQAYDLTHLLALAITQAKTSERSRVRDTLEKLGRYEGVIRTYDTPFTHNDHEALGREDYFFGRFREDGAIIPLSQH